MTATKPDGIARTCRTEVIVDAPAEAVWRVIADVTRTGEWSHECHQAAWLHGATQAAPGVRFRGRNRSGLLRWSRVCEVIAVDAPREIAWRTIPSAAFPDSTEWRIALEPAGSGTRITQSYQVTRCPGWYEWIVARVNPAHIDRSGALAGDLRRIGAIAAGDTQAEPAG
jgi:uncharacterized protein YndB with AHSA1/START domain